MARSVAVAVENNFRRGLITEASGLNFPENACTDTFDCHFELTGEVRRRLGYDTESGFTEKTIDRDGGAISTYLWKNVAGDGNVTLFVAQIGNTLYFWDVSQSQSLSPGAISDTVDLTTFKPAGASDPAPVECQFSDGNGYLFVTHPTLESFFISYDSDTETATATEITIEIRDFAGVTEDPVLAINERPTTLSTSHNYNLRNQGWNASDYEQFGSSTSITAGLGSKIFTVASGGPWAAGDPIFAWSKGSFQGSSSGVNQYMAGTVSSYSGTTLTLLSSLFNGSGALTDWFFASSTDHIQLFNQVTSTYPSNADVWWNFKDADELFNPRKTISHVNRGTTPAPKGHFILEVYNQQRSTVSGVVGITDVTTGVFRASTSAFFAGRVFYSGIPFAGYSGNIYFSQIIEPGTSDRFGHCYQQSDPTNENLFDLLPSDGGVITIPEAGTILKLWSMQGGLMVFASNGVWHVTGSQGIGFTANDYTVRRLSTIRAISHTSFVDVGGYPAWWSAEGIYILQPDQSLAGVSIKSLTDESIFSFYQEIPITCKKQARGFFNLVTKKIQWLYRSTVPGTVEEVYEYDRILNWNALTAAINPWTISESDVKIHSIVVPESSGGSLVAYNVIDDAADTVVDDLGNQVISYQIQESTVQIPVFKYFTSYEDGGSYEFTFHEENSESYMDFFSHDDVGVDYTSYFITGYKVHGQGQRKFQSNYVYIFVNEIPSQYNFQGIWNYANTGDSGDWSSQAFQSVIVSDTNYDIKYNRLKVRGEGLALQYKVYSEEGQPFSIVGWSVYETGNASV
jgi:hypothetical protein